MFAFLFVDDERRRSQFADADGVALLYLIAAGLVALAIAVETYFQNERWPLIATLAMAVASVVAVILAATVSLAAPGYAVDLDGGGALSSLPAAPAIHG